MKISAKMTFKILHIGSLKLSHNLLTAASRPLPY